MEEGNDAILLQSLNIWLFSAFFYKTSIFLCLVVFYNHGCLLQGGTSFDEEWELHICGFKDKYLEYLVVRDGAGLVKQLL